VSASASSTLTGDVTVGAHAAVDGDPATAWLAEPTEDKPVLRLAWSGARRMDRIRLVVPQAPVAARTTQVVLGTDAGDFAAAVGADGWVRFPAVTTSRLDITVNSAEKAVADPRGNGWPAPPGIAEVEVPALGNRLSPASDSTPLVAPCGTGPAVEIDGVSYPTSVSGTLGDVRASRPLPVTICDDFASDSVPLTAGEHHLRTLPSKAFVGESATLVRDGATAVPAVTRRDVKIGQWDATERTVTVGSGAAALLVVPENLNAGWAATLNGQDLRPVRVDGWQQAFALPAGEGGTVTLRFEPDEPYRTGLAAGAVCVLLVVLLALAPVRRRWAPAAHPQGRPSRRIPGGEAWMLVPLMALIVTLGGAAGAVLLLIALIVRQLWPRALPALAFISAVTGLVVAVGGRLLGEGQELAYGAAVQLAMLAAVCWVAATAAPAAGRPAEEQELLLETPEEPAAEEPYRATLRRSVGLFRTFLVEQTDPDRFYSLLATDSVRQLGSYVKLDGARVLDVGGGPGYFSSEFARVGATYLGIDPAVGDFAAAGAEVSGMVRGSGTALPIRTGVLDVCYSSNVLEHVDAPEAMLDEMLRVTRPGGTIYVSFTPWYSPHGGHETAPWHFLGGQYARRRYQRKNGREPKNRFMESLFPVSAARAMRWVRAARRAGDVTVVDVLPRYHPKWAKWVARVPVLRETLTWNFTVVLRRTGEPDSTVVQEDVARVSLPDVTQ
jgi:arabinofuranan 3-O-arabinosyltransferase